MPFEVGDVLLVWYAYKDENGVFKKKPRPAVISKIHNQTNSALIQITSTNRSNTLPGYWITKESDTGKKMGLLKDSFINISEVYWIPDRYIIRKIGNYPNIDEAIDKMNELGIKPKREIEP